MLFEYSSYGVGASPDMKLIVFTPLAEKDTVRKVEHLLKGSCFKPGRKGAKR